MVPTKSYMLSLIVIFTFSTLDRKYRFWANLVQKIILTIQDGTWYLDYFKYAEFDVLVLFFCFGQKIPFWGKNWLKIAYFGKLSNSKNTIFGRIAPKNKRFLFNLKVNASTNSNILTSLLVFFMFCVRNIKFQQAWSTISKLSV